MKIPFSFATLLVLLGSATAQASTSNSAPATNLIVVGGKVFFNQTSTRTAVPACATVTNRWVFDGSTAQGQAMLATLLTLRGLNRPVSVIGTGTCPDWADTETVAYLLEG